MPLHFTLYTGSDVTTSGVCWREAIAKDGITERITVSESPGLLADAVSSPPLFGDQRIVAADLDGISEDELNMIAFSAPHSDTIVIARATEINSARRKLIESFGSVVSYAIPQSKELPSRIDTLAQAAQVRLSSESRRVLLDRAGDDLDRVFSVLEQCRIGHLAEPTPRQLLVLLGTSQRDILPWDVSDAIDRQDLALAIEIALRCDPIPLVAYLSNRYLEAARVRERYQKPNTHDTIEITGQGRWQAEKTSRLASKFSNEEFNLLLSILAKSDRLLKTNKDSSVTISSLISALMKK